MRNHIICFKDTDFGPMFLPLGSENIDFTIVVNDVEKTRILLAYQVLKSVQKLIRERKFIQDSDEEKERTNDLPFTDH